MLRALTFKTWEAEQEEGFSLALISKAVFPENPLVTCIALPAIFGAIRAQRNGKDACESALKGAAGGLAFLGVATMVGFTAKIVTSGAVSLAGLVVGTTAAPWLAGTCAAAGLYTLCRRK